MKAATLRLYQTLHTWVGLMAGWALFIAFFAGAITVFHEELHAWQNPLRTHHGDVATSAIIAPADIDHFVDTLVRTHPAAAASAYVIFPNAGEPDFSAYWQNSKGDWQMTTGTSLAAGKTSPKDLSIEPMQGELANFLNRLHYSLGLETPGMYFMGAISVLYGVALISGVLLHLPRLKKDLLAVRPGRNLKRFWMDMHNVLGLFSLPFHLIFAITAPVLCLSVVLMAVFNTVALNGKLFDAVPRVTTAAGTVAAANRAASMLPAENLLARAREAAGANFIVSPSTTSTLATQTLWRKYAAAARAQWATMARWRSVPPPTNPTAARSSATRRPMRATPTTPSTASSTACTSAPTAMSLCASPTS